MLNFAFSRMPVRQGGEQSCFKSPYEEQNCEPLYFLGGMFRGSALNWPIIEKEAFAIMESVDRLDYLLQRPTGFRILCDHRNLIYIFSENAEHKKATSQKLERWTMRLLGYRYIIEHISGEDNKWADLLSRWAQPQRIMRLNRFHCQPMLNPLGQDFQWPTIQQAKPPSVSSRPDLALRDGVWYKQHSQALWIPEEEDELMTRLLITTQFGAAGHRGTNATQVVLKEYCYWRNPPTSVQRFCKLCLHCLHTRGGKTEPRPLGTQMHADKPNRMLHFDFLQLDEAYNGWNYVLVIKDDYSHFTELVGVEAATAEATARALQDWFKRFGIVQQWVSDQGSHFKNKVIEALQKHWGAAHHFTTAYTPWANGTVEVVNIEIKKVLRTLRTEMKKSVNESPDLLRLVQYILNQTPVASLGNLAPVEVFAMLETTPALRALIGAAGEEYIELPDAVQVRTLYEDLCQTMRQMHKKVDEAKNKGQEYNKKKTSELRTRRLCSLGISRF